MEDEIRNKSDIRQEIENYPVWMQSPCLYIGYGNRDNNSILKIEPFCKVINQ